MKLEELLNRIPWHRKKIFAIKMQYLSFLGKWGWLQIIHRNICIIKKLKKIRHYKKYVGQYVKRFYNTFEEKNIYKIADFRINKYGIEEYLYVKNDFSNWLDCEDSCIITNELPDLKLDWVANTNDQDYKGYNPFEKND
jgi:hypothetical protein